MKEYNVAVAGATGAVGQEMIKILEERNFPVKKLLPLASQRSVGKEIVFKGNKIEVELLTKNSFKEIDIALFSAGAKISKEISPFAAKDGAIVIDNSSAFRMDKDVPLVVPEVNPQETFKHKGIIANPNCSTIQLVVVLNPIHKKVKIKRLVIATYQSVSGWGKEAIQQLWEETAKLVKKYQNIKDTKLLKETNLNINLDKKALPYQIAFNLIPQIDIFLENDYTKEEMKLVNETKKIMQDETIKVTATCVRVPVFFAHSEAVNIETEKEISTQELIKILKNSPGIKVIDEPSKNLYPLPLNASGEDEVFVGRIRKDKTIKNGFNLWIVSDNLRKGAALNAIQIAELLIRNK
jgi:aspartate-semialdehyde dehydrogenase